MGRKISGKNNLTMEDMNILAFFLSYPSLPIDALEKASEEAIKKGDEFRTYIWGE